jgi:hypothetical protein
VGSVWDLCGIGVGWDVGFTLLPWTKPKHPKSHEFFNDLSAGYLWGENREDVGRCGTRVEGCRMARDDCRRVWAKCGRASVKCGISIGGHTEEEPRCLDNIIWSVMCRKSV